MQLAVVEQVAGTVVEVVARGRALRAHRLQLSGMQCEDIAAEVGYASGRVAAMAVTAWLEKVAVEQGPEHRRQALQLELDRLDALQAVFWAGAMQQDRHAAEVVLKVIARRAKILGFDKPDASLAPRPAQCWSGHERGVPGHLADADRRRRITGRPMTPNINSGVKVIAPTLVVDVVGTPAPQGSRS